MHRWLGLEPGDIRRVAPMVAAYGLTLTIIYVLKPARNAIFLDRLGVEQLPWVLMLVALVGGVTTVLYSRSTSMLPVERLVPATFAVLGGILLIFRALLPLQAGWVVFAFYIFVQVFGLLSTSLMWLWANAAFDPREARRLFGLIGTGGIVGSIVGGFFTGQVAGAVGTVNLLFVAALLIGLVLFVLRLAPAARSAPVHRSTDASTAADLRLPRLLAVNAGLIAIVAVFVDVQFNDLVARTFEDADRKAAFFGRFFAGISLLSLVVQMSVTPWLLRHHGVGVALGVLPGALGAGALAFWAVPQFPIGALPKAADGGFRHSVHKAASEVAFLPIPGDVKKRIKLIIDTFVDTAATGLGALTVLVLTGPLAFGYADLTALVVMLLVGVGVLTYRLRGAYVDAFRRALETRRIDLADLTTGLDEASVLKALRTALTSDNPRQIAYGLDLASSLRTSALRDSLTRLLEHPTATIRCRALEVLGRQSDAVPAERLEDIVRRDETAEVQAEALVQLLQGDLDRARSRLAAMLDQPGSELGALMAVGRLPDVADELLTPERIDRFKRGDEPTRAALAGALAVAGRREVLADLLDNAPHTVARAAMDGMARSHDPRYVDWLAQSLSDRALRGTARRTLSQLGDRAADAMGSVLSDPRSRLAERRIALRVLSDMDSALSEGRLTDALFAPEPMLARTAVEGLLRRRQRSGLSPAARTVRRAIDDRIDTLALVEATLAHLARGSETPRRRLFAQAVRERRDSSREEIFSLLALLYPVDAILDAQRGLESDRDRANALEYLENTLSVALRERLIPLLESTASAPSRSAAELFEAWQQQKDPWLRACAVFAWPDLSSVDKDLLPVEDPHPLVAETVEHVLSAQRI
jgi:AAA family ATP:ADP antiporter